jgi:polyisoprenoid-binding protein YceI
MRAAIAALAIVATQANAAQEVFDVEPAHTYPYFEVSHLGISTYRGRFDRTRGAIALDREAGTGSIDITIDTARVSTGNAMLDELLRGEDFFNTARYPAMNFHAGKIAFEGGVPKSATGEFTMLGVTRPVELGILRFGCTRLPFFVRLTCGADVVASIRRSDFGMASYAAFVGDEVRLLIEVEAVKREPAAEPAPAGG